jgi:Fe-S oxidoreductase
MQRGAEAAVEVLEAAGYQVHLPRARLCCGRPVYDHGMLGIGERAPLPAVRGGCP